MTTPPLPTILLVDASPESRSALRAALKPLQARVIGAASGKAALGLLRENQCALVLIEDSPDTEPVRAAAEAQSVPVLQIPKPLDAEALRARVASLLQLAPLETRAAARYGAPMGEASPAMLDVDLRAFLGGTSFFGGLDPKIAELVMAMLKERRVPAGATLFNEGESGNSMYIVREGALLVKRHCPHGTEARLQMMRPGDFFGVTALIEMEARPFGCVAEKDSVVYELTNSDLYKLYKTDLKGYVLVLQNITRELCRRLRKAATRIAQLEDTLSELHHK